MRLGPRVTEPASHNHKRSPQGLWNLYKSSSLSKLDHFLANNNGRRCLKVSHFQKYGGVLWRQNLWLTFLLFKWTASSIHYKLDFACFLPVRETITENKGNTDMSCISWEVGLIDGTGVPSHGLVHSSNKGLGPALSNTLIQTNNWLSQYPYHN